METEKEGGKEEVNKLFAVAFLLIAYYSFYFKNDTGLAIFYMTHVILFAVFDARDVIKELMEK